MEIKKRYILFTVKVGDEEFILKMRKRLVGSSPFFMPISEDVKSNSQERHVFEVKYFSWTVKELRDGWRVAERTYASLERIGFNKYAINVVGIAEKLSIAFRLSFI